MNIVKLPQYTALQATATTPRALAFMVKVAHREAVYQENAAYRAAMQQPADPDVKCRAYALTPKALAYLEERRNDQH